MEDHSDNETRVRRPRRQPEGELLRKFMSEAELATELGISTRTIIRWRRLHEAPPHTRIARRIFYHRDTAAAWLAARQRGAA